MKPAHDFLEDLQRFSVPIHADTQNHSKDVLSLNNLEVLGRRLLDAQSAVTNRSKRALRQHLDLVPDSPLVAKFSLFKSIGMCRQETVHTNALGWLLDPKQPHGFGHALFDAFLRSVAHSNQHNGTEWEQLLGPGIQVIRVVPEFYLSSTCRVDLLVEGVLPNRQSWLLLIEAKVGARERARQLMDYDTALRGHLGSRPQHVRVFRIFLSEDGRTGHTAASDSAWASLSYRALAKDFLRVYPTVRGCEGHSFFRIYLAGLIEDTCGLTCADSLDTLLQYNPYRDLESLLESEDA